VTGSFWWDLLVGVAAGLLPDVLRSVVRRAGVGASPPAPPKDLRWRERQRL